MHDGWKSWEVGGERDTGDGGDGGGEALEELALLNVEHVWWESVGIAVHLGDTHAVGEWRDVQHVEEGSLGGSDLASCLDELQVVGDFDGTTSDLGWDTKSLEERGLSWLHSSVTSWDVDIGWSNGTGTSWSSDLVGENLVTDGLEVTVGEDESDVALDVWKETLVLWGVGLEALDGATDLLIVRIDFANVPYSCIPWCSFPSIRHHHHGETV